MNSSFITLSVITSPQIAQDSEGRKYSFPFGCQSLVARMFAGSYTTDLRPLWERLELVRLVPLPFPGPSVVAPSCRSPTSSTPGELRPLLLRGPAPRVCALAEGRGSGALTPGGRGGRAEGKRGLGLAGIERGGEGGKEGRRL